MAVEIIVNPVWAESTPSTNLNVVLLVGTMKEQTMNKFYCTTTILFVTIVNQIISNASVYVELCIKTIYLVLVMISKAYCI